MRKDLCMIFFFIFFIISDVCLGRFVRDFDIDRDTNECETIVLAKINEISLRKKAVTYGRFIVDELNISITIIIPIKGQNGDNKELTFLHRKANYDNSIEFMENGFSSFEFKTGCNYLLFLKHNEAGILELPCPEGHSIVRFSDEILGTLKDLPKEDTAIECVINILLNSFFSEKQSPSDSIKSFSLLTQSKAFKPKIQQESLKKEFIERLIEIKETKEDWSVLSGAYYYLSRLGEPADISEIIDYIIGSERLDSDRFNALEWLKNYPEEIQIKALREIVNECEDESILKQAQYRLTTIFSLTTNNFAGSKFKSQAEVSSYVDTLTGFNILEGISKSIKQIDVNDDNTPFLHGQIKGKKNVWLTEIKNVRLKLKSRAPGSEDKYNRNFEVLIDPNNGTLLRITSKFNGYDPNMLPEPPAMVAEAQLRSRKEVYHGFPDEDPNITFLDALGALLDQGPVDPLLSKEIHALYIMHSRADSEARPVWIITLRGIPPIPVIGSPRGIPDEHMPPVWLRNHIRVVVDADTGKVLFANNTPQSNITR